MRILLAEPRGFCQGVKRAVKIAFAQAEPAGKIFTLGPIIHNPQIIEQLSRRGVKKTESLSQIEEGVVIIRSHGVGPGVYQAAEQKNLKIVDATCPHVKKAQQAAFNLTQAGFKVVIIGDSCHPEVIGLKEWAGADSLVVGKPEDLAAISWPAPKIAVVIQTTFPAGRAGEIISYLQAKYGEVKVVNTICPATEQRQSAARKLARAVDAMIVVGGRNSANTVRLVQICQEAGSKVFPVERASELTAADFINVHQVGITAGASTPEEVIEEVCNKMQEISDSLEKPLKSCRKDEVIKGTVVNIRPDEVFVDIGGKAEGLIPLAELADPVPDNALAVVTVGQEIDVYVVDDNTTDGIILLSKIRADNVTAWEKLAQAAETAEPISCKVIKAIKGGLQVTAWGARGFMPASQVDLKYVEDLTEFVNQTVEALILELDPAKKRLVLSRRLFLARQRQQEKERVLAGLNEGQIIKGVVKKIEKFGAFVDLGGIDGLIPLSELAWGKVAAASEVLKVGDEISVVVKHLNRETEKVSLSLKDLLPDPWYNCVKNLTEGMIIEGVVKTVSQLGAFVEIDKNVQGLVHISELSDHRINDAKEVLNPGQTIKVKILKIDNDRKRIALSYLKAQQDEEQQTYRQYLKTQPQGSGYTIGERFGRLFSQRIDDE